MNFCHGSIRAVLIVQGTVSRPYQAGLRGFKSYWIVL